jgi:23S rRNA (pseudouridine1915-N3)-methyltransferase
MKINIIIVDKKSKESLYTPLIEHYKKISKTFVELNIIEVFNKDISKAQDISSLKSQESYSIALGKYLNSGYNIALDPSSKEVDSYQFADLLRDKSTINFFIGGAYGFEKKFINRCNSQISMGKITLSHKLIKVVLMEQIFRGLTIINNHPYHK